MGVRFTWLSVGSIVFVTGCGLTLDLDPPTDAAGGMDAGGAPCTSDAECDDGDVCDGAELCDPASGRCVEGERPACDTTTPCMEAYCDPVMGCGERPRDCDDRVDCTDDSCDTATDRCVHSPDHGACPAASAICERSYCDRSSGCTVRDLCQQLGGTCEGDGSCNLGRPCSDATCLGVTSCLTGICEGNRCRQEPKAEGGSCFPDACTQGVCSADGHCRSQAPIICGPPSSPCQTSTCDPMTGCQMQNVDGIPCDADGDNCTIDSCLDGRCQQESVTDCVDVDPNDCQIPTGCDTSGRCQVTLLDGDQCLDAATGDCGVCRVGLCETMPMGGVCGCAGGLPVCGVGGLCCNAGQFCLAGVCTPQHDCDAGPGCPRGTHCCECAPSRCIPDAIECPLCSAP